MKMCCDRQTARLCKLGEHVVTRVINSVFQNNTIQEYEVHNKNHVNDVTIIQMTLSTVCNADLEVCRPTLLGCLF